MSARFVGSILWVFLTIGPMVQTAALAQSAAANPIVTVASSLNKTRSNHTATLLPNGKVLIAGGSGFPCVPCSAGSCIGNFCYLSVNNTAELHDPVTDTWSLTGSLSRRVFHSATLLPNGSVLVVGGMDYGYDVGLIHRFLDTAELYDPVTGRWRPTQSPIEVGGLNHAILLPNGKVLAVDQEQALAELFDPSTETWSLTGVPSIRGPLTLLPDGKVLIAGNGEAELYDPARETWERTGGFNAISVVGTVTLLRTGQVLATGTSSDFRVTTAELYDPTTRTWRITGALNYRRWGGSATLLPNGRVLLAGGYDPYPSSYTELTSNSMELYDPATGAWTPMPSLSVRRTFHTATVLPNDKVLFVGGIDGDFDIGTVWHSSAELFDLRLPRPTSLLISPDTVSQGQCFTMTVGNGSGMTLDVQYRHEGDAAQTITNWPKLDSTGQAENICTSLQTPTGVFQFTAIRNAETGQWLPISTWVVVTSP